jgi:N-acetyl-anhydromuramyl-L-alanine amidase AmpD
MYAVRNQETTYIVIHCSATPPGRDIGVADIDAIHRARGWNGCGYHLVIRRTGKVEAGRHLYEVGAHTTGYNYKSVGVCMVGGLSKDVKKTENNFTSEQWKSLKKTVDFLCLMFPKAKVVGHRDLSPDTNNDGVIQQWEWLKTCPAFDVSKWEGADRSPITGETVWKI